MKAFKTILLVSMPLADLLISCTGTSPKAQATVSRTSGHDVSSYLQDATQTHHHLIVTYPNGQKCLVIMGTPVECWSGTLQP